MANTAPELRSVPNVTSADALAATASTLTGVSDALSYRAAAEDDAMLAMLASVIDSQVDNLIRVKEQIATSPDSSKIQASRIAADHVERPAARYEPDVSPSTE